ncbi:MAG: protein kinase [Candidatus Riflebacteria bacterium]|nr:protein kinase [Candidatus Riflebacteria bacterium]
MRRKTSVGDTIFGRFRIQSLIGEGGQGFVWRGADQVDSTPVAIKELTSESVELRKRFEREMELKLDHPNIIQVRQYGEDGGNYYFVMEFLDGENLATILEKKGRISEAEATRIVRAVADGLSAAHSSNIIHRDIKPENIMVLTDGRVKITDFGIACFLDKERVTRMGATMGTAHYMSPEQVEDVSRVDRSSDVFSLGVVFYELLTGKKPFDADMLGELYVSIITKEPARPREIIPALSPQIETVVVKMLAKRPEDRFPSMEELLSGLPGAPQSPGARTRALQVDGITGAFDPGSAPPAPVAPAAPRPKERTGVPCPACKTVNRLGSSFCAKCGFDLRGKCLNCQSPMATGANFCPRCGHPSVECQSQGYFVGLKGGFSGERLSVDKDFLTMGRHSSNDVSFADGKDDYVSRFQARVYRDRGCVWIEGWDWVKNGVTTNGTFVNGRNVDGKGKVMLRHGDRIRLGDSFFRFEMVEAGSRKSDS